MKLDARLSCISNLLSTNLIKLENAAIKTYVIVNRSRRQLDTSYSRQPFILTEFTQQASTTTTSIPDGKTDFTDWRG